MNESIREHVNRLRQIGDTMTTAVALLNQLMQVAAVELAQIEEKTKPEDGDGKLRT